MAESKKSELYCIFDDILDAYLYEENEFLRYYIQTKIVVGSRNDCDIDNIHFELAFQTLEKRYPNITVTKVLPENKNITLGKVNVKETKKSDNEGSLGWIAKFGIRNFFSSNLAINIIARRERKNSMEIKKPYSYPNYVAITTSEGAGHHCTWKFKNLKYIEKQGTYNLCIFFQIPKDNQIDHSKDTKYETWPKIIVNEEELIFRRDRNGEYHRLGPIPIYFHQK